MTTFEVKNPTTLELYEAQLLEGIKNHFDQDLNLKSFVFEDVKEKYEKNILSTAKRLMNKLGIVHDRYATSLSRLIASIINPERFNDLEQTINMKKSNPDYTSESLESLYRRLADRTQAQTKFINEFKYKIVETIQRTKDLNMNWNPHTFLAQGNYR